MASKRTIHLLCPTCGQDLMEIRGTCQGILVICSKCASSILFDVSENGRMTVKCDPIFMRKMPSENTKTQTI